MISNQIQPQPVEKLAPEPQLTESKNGLWLLLTSLTVLYSVLIWIGIRRFVWFDELFTLDIARAKNLTELWRMSLKLDANPVPVYLLSRVSMAMFGSSPLGLRLPSILEFYAGSVAIFFYVRRKAGSWYGMLAVLTVWAGSSFLYAIEARPYGLVFMFFSLMLLCWDSAASHTRRTPALWCLGIANVGLLSSWVFAPLSLFPFLVAEVVRFYQRRKPDYPLWAALFLPMVVMLTYIPLIENYQRTLIFPYYRQASLAMVGEFYYYAFDSVVHFSFWIACLAAVAVLLSRRLRAKLFSRTSLAGTALFATLVLIPLLLNLALMRRQGAFYLRYCLTSQVALYILVAVLLAVQFRCSRLVAGIASVLMLAMIVRHDVSLVLRQPHPRNAAFLSTIRPDLPVVVGSGMTFVEMNHYEDPDFLKRVYYLKNRTAELRYEHSTYFEDYEAMDDLKMAFPIMSAPVEAYSSFVRQHREFLLFTSDYDWILHQLRADGASLTQISLAGAQTPYRESRELYLVKMPSDGI